jgi:hypothetical protein
LRSHGLERDFQVRHKVEGPSGDTAVQLAEFGQAFVGADYRFTARAFHEVPEETAGTEEGLEGVEVASELLLEEFGEFFGKVMQLE